MNIKYQSVQTSTCMECHKLPHISAEHSPYKPLREGYVVAVVYLLSSLRSANRHFCLPLSGDSLGVVLWN